MALEIILTLFLVFANGFFVAAEFAIVKVRASQIALEKKSLSKKWTLHIVDHLDGYLAATQLGITLASLGLGWVGEDVVSKLILNAVNAMGVYAAYDPELDRKVAVKLLRAGISASVEARTRLLREAQALARLGHPNVVAVHYTGSVGERVWLAMEFVEGQTLAAWCAGQTQGRSRWREVMAAMMHAGRGLQAAHEAGLVHRDFKPDNVMVSRDGRVRVMDLVLARRDADAAERAAQSGPGNGILSLHLTQDGAVMGTPAYMAPEQFEGAEVTPASDVFAFSVTLWEALYGVRPYAGETMLALVANLIAGRLQAPPRGRRVPTWLRRVLERGLAPAPERRWPGMQAMLTALARGHTRARARVLGAGALA